MISYRRLGFDSVAREWARTREERKLVAGKGRKKGSDIITQDITGGKKEGESQAESRTERGGEKTSNWDKKGG